MDLTHLTLTEAAAGLLQKEFSALELTKAFLERINLNDKKIHSYLSLFNARAVTKAEEVDGEGIVKVMAKKPLSGLPMAIKDNLMIEGTVVTAGSKILENYKAVYTATVLEKLKDEGVIVLGKTNLDEFAMGSSTENSAFGPTKNPWNIKKVPGGSSGGSAAAVAADLCLAALGSDTGGSIRQPASFCGVVGYKPTYGLVSRYGLVAMASSLDQIGPITKTVKDAAWLADSMSGCDVKDATTTSKDIKLLDKLDKFNIKGIRIGLPKEYFAKELNKDLVLLIKQKVAALEKEGAIVREVSLPLTKYNLPVYYIIMFAESSSNLGRFDGIRYGFSDRSGGNLESVYMNSKSKGFGAEVRRRIFIGTYALSSGYYEAYYGRAQKVRNMIKKEFDDIFNKIDFLITPTTPTAAFDLGSKTANPIDMYLQDIFTVSANVAGLPAISIPAGLIGKLPVGLQILGKQFDDARMLGLANMLESEIKFARLKYA